MWVWVSVGGERWRREVGVARTPERNHIIALQCLTWSKCLMNANVMVSFERTTPVMHALSLTI